MGELIETYAGVPTALAVTASDGKTDLYLKASVFNSSSPSPITSVNMVHQSLGFYRATVTLSTAGIYRAVYANYTDEARTIPDTTRDNDQDTILVNPLDQPKVAVAYDQATDRLLVEVTISRNGTPMPAAELTRAEIMVYDSDNHLIININDLAPDTLGVFRLTKTAPNLVPGHLYYVYAVVVTATAGTVTANKGFQTAE